jgi:hypothetical protein
MPGEEKISGEKSGETCGERERISGQEKSPVEKSLWRKKREREYLARARMARARVLFAVCSHLLLSSGYIEERYGG